MHYELDGFSIEDLMEVSNGFDASHGLNLMKR